jgi:DNA invertase Pin-like site-specific DNA recombinase
MVKTLADAGSSYREIQRATDVSLGTISKVIREFESNKPLVEFYKKNRADLLALDQATYRSHITKEKLEKASAKDLELMRCMAYDKERLERGESTENVAVIYAAITDLQKRRAKGEA